MASQDFTIDAKLRIAGIETKGDLDAGTLKFKVDTSALKKLVSDAAKAAAKVKRQFDKIKINKIKIEINKNSLRAMESQIRRAIQNAVGKVKIQANVAGVAGAAGGVAGGAATGLPLPSSARTIKTSDLSKEIEQIKKVGAFDDQVTNQQVRNAGRLSAARSKAQAARQKSISTLKRNLDDLFRKEQRLQAQIAGGGGRGGAGGNVPPGGFGATPPGGNFDKSGGSLRQLQTAMSNIGSETKQASGAMVELDELAFQVGKKAAAFRGVAIAINTIVNAAQAGARFLIEFTDSLRELNKILQATDVRLQLIGNELFELSASTGVAIDKTLEIATEFARAGLSGRGYGSVVQLTSQALTGLQGTTLDVAQSTQILIQIIQQVEAGARGLNKELVTTTKLFDILGKAEDITASKAQDVADALRRSAASLFATGSTIEEVTAIISVLQERTRRGGDVIGTALKTLSARIADSSSKASQALRSIGVATIDAEGKLRKTFDVLRDTAAAFRNLSEAEQANIAVKTAGLRQVEILRAALLDFNRIEEVRITLSEASGDATRKQAVEQTKLANSIEKIKLSLQELIKNASSGILGQAFALAIRGAEALLGAFADLDRVFGGTLSTFTGIFAIKAAFFALVPLVKGIGKAIQFFVTKQQEAKSATDGVNASSQAVATTIDGKVNVAMRNTVNIMNQLNQGMKQFQQQSELAAVQAERLGKARKLAQAQAGVIPLAGAKGGFTSDSSSVSRRTQEILRQQQQPGQDARQASLRGIIAGGGSRGLVQAAKDAPGAFSAKEREAIARVERGLAKDTKNTSKAMGGLRKQLVGLRGNVFAGGIALSALAGIADGVAKSSRRAGDQAGALSAEIGGAAAQFGAMGALLGGPVGFLVGAFAGSLTKLFNVLNESKLTIQTLTDEYISLGLIQADNGEITAFAAKEMEKAFKNIKGFKDFQTSIGETTAKDLTDPQREVNRLKKLEQVTDRLIKGFDRTLDLEEQRQKILEAATRATRERTGAGIDLTSTTLGQNESQALKEVTETAFKEIIESLASLAGTEEGAEAVRTRGAELLRTSSAEGEFGKGRVGKAGIALARALTELPGLIGQSIIDAQNQAARETRAGRLEEQKQAFGELRTQLAIPLGQIGKLLGTPVNQLQVQLRTFIDQFGQEIIKLEQATLRASTPQKELANKLAEFAKVGLVAAERRETLGGTDAINEFRQVIDALPGAGGKVGRAGRTAQGAILPGFDETTADVTVGEIRSKFAEALLGPIEQIRREGIIDVDEQRKLLEAQLKNLPSLSTISDEDRKTIVDAALKAGKTMVKLETSTAQARIKVNKTAVAALRATLTEQQKEISINKQRREVLALNTQAAIEELTGIRKLVAQRDLESTLAQEGISNTKNRVDVLNELIAKEREVLAVDKENIASQDKLKILTEERTKTTISLENQLAKERIAGIKNTLQVAREAIDAGKKEAGFQRSMISGRAEIIDLLAVGQKQMDKFNTSLKRNADTFRITQAELAGETEVVNRTIKDETEKQARLADINKRAAVAALEHARAEAEVIAERREAIKQISQELLGNQQAQVEAQKSVIDATKGVSDAFTAYLQAVDGAILATTRYNLNLRLVDVENRKLLGGFSSMKQEISAVQDAFREAESAARQMGASERTLVDLRRESINQQLQLFNQLLQDQSSLARSFFQSSAQDQADLFRGIQAAQGVAEALGGSFENFKKLGTGAINDLGAQLLALPQETRQKIIQSLETLKTIGGSVGGFNADELLKAIETTALGIGGAGGLDVDPLFEVQERIANLNEEQARIATEQLIASNQQVQDVKQGLEIAEAARDLAEIQLERVKEEGDKLRGKLTDLQGSLNTTLLRQEQTQRNGFNAVTSAVGRATHAITNTLPDALSVKIAAAFREVLSTLQQQEGGALAGGLGQATTEQSRGAGMAETLRKAGANKAQAQQIANQSGQSLNVLSQTLGSPSQSTTSNLDQDSLVETNRRLDEMVKQLENLNVTSTTSSETLEEISQGAGGGVTAAATVAIPDINVNIQGQQQITVTGFEAGVARIAASLAETFGGFVTETEARNIANEVVDAIRLQLERNGIIQRNQI